MTTTALALRQPAAAGKLKPAAPPTGASAAPPRVRPSWRDLLDQHSLPLPVFMIGGLKGGLGKSTTAWKLLLALSEAGFNPLGADLDPVSQTLVDSYRQAIGRGYEVPFNVIDWPTPKGLREGVQRAITNGGHDALVLDTGGHIPQNDPNAETDAALMFDAAALLADELVVPCGPSEPELRRLPATFAAAKRVSVLNPELAVSVLLVKARTRSRARDRALTFLSGVGVPLLETVVPDTDEYKEAFGHATGAAIYAEVLAEVVRKHVADRAESNEEVQGQ